MSKPLNFIEKLMGKKEKPEYKKMLIIPAVLMLIAISIIGNSYIQTGEIFQRSIELKGGTLITVSTESAVDIQALESSLSSKFGEVKIRRTTGIGLPSIIVEASEDADTDEILAEMRLMGIDTSLNSIENIGTSLGSSFWSQAQMGIILAFVMMGIIVFLLFRKPVPSILVILCAVFDITATLAFMQVFGIAFSLASLAALLMLIGYSVDTDIMLTTRFLKETDEPFNERLSHALKTGLTETLTSIAAVSALVITAITPVLTEIATVLLIGLTADIIFTWAMNSVLLRQYMEKTGLI